MDIHLFVSAQEELSKTDRLFQSYDNIFTKINSSEIEELFEKHIVQHLDSVKKGNEKLWRHDTFYKNYAEQFKTQKNENSKPINLTFYLDYGALRKEHLDTLTNFINSHEKFKGSLDYNLKVLLPEALIKLAQVTFKCNREEAEFYLNGSVAGTDCNKISSRRLAPNSSESLYVLPKWEKPLAIERCNSYSFCKIFIFCQYKLSGVDYQTCCNKKNVCKLKGKYLGKIVKTGHGRNLRKEYENLQILRKFLPRKSLYH